MKLLILGGTRFLGRHLAQQALDAGHELTLLHRGRSGVDLFPQARHLIVDRDGDLGALTRTAPSGGWDCVIDTSAYFPRQVRAVAAALSNLAGRYQLVSSISAYVGFAEQGNDEDAPLATLSDPSVETITGETYGGLKVLCEQAAVAGFPGRALIVRPGLIVGPYDPTGRCTWWVQRLQRGGEVLAPGTPDAPVQFIDARDVAAWQLLQAERGCTGVFNLTGPTEATTMGGFLQAAAEGVGAEVRLQWVPEHFLLERAVAPWSDLPVWLPGASAGMHRTHIQRAVDTGLQTRALSQTAADIAAWAGHASPAPAPAPPPAPAPGSSGLLRPKAGLSPAREAELLAQWREQGGGDRRAG